MAVLSKIRQRSLLLVGAIGVALFAFVIGGVFESGFFGDSGRYVGSINGKDVSTEEFRFKVTNQEQQNPGSSQLMISNNIWGQEIKNTLYEEQFKKLGLISGKAQIEGVLEQSGNYMFLDDAGKFNAAKFNQYIEDIKLQAPTQWRLWLEDYEKQLEGFANEQAYNTLVKAGINTTGFDGKVTYQREANKVNFDYVAVSYSSINDDEVKVTDAEIIDYMSKRKDQYRGDDSRDFEYILIESSASEDDVKEIEEGIASLLQPKTVYNESTEENETVQGFATIENIEEFVNTNSDIPFSEKYIFAKDLPSMTDTNTGAVTPIYKENDYVKVSRILDHKVIADSVKSSHILIPFTGSMAANEMTFTTKEDAKRQADSILVLVRNNEAKFKEVADEINTDGSKGNGGEIGWIRYSQITYEGFDKDFAEFIFFKPKGSVDVVETKFGFHIIKIDDNGSKSDAYKLATIARQIEPSNKTNDDVYASSQKIEIEAQTKSLQEIADEQKLTLIAINGITAVDENIQGLDAQRAMVTWAFAKDTKKGSVKRFDISRGHVIAKLKNINENGLQSAEKMRASLEPIIRNQKKAALIKEKIKGTTLEEIAKANEETIRNASGVSLADPMLQGLGAEPKVVGRAFGIEEAKVSEPIEGKIAVYVIKKQSVVNGPELPNYATYSNRMKTQNQNTAQGRIFLSLRNKADIKDNRINLGF